MALPDRRCLLVCLLFVVYGHNLVFEYPASGHEVIAAVVYLPLARIAYRYAHTGGVAVFDVDCDAVVVRRDLFFAGCLRGGAC